jgi:NAD(P)-dependent dehydrogenase (short-subunit alcohol dehydrogenase family)
MKSLNKKIVLITGAGQGIGKATAMAFAAQGSLVAVNDIDADSVQDTVKEIQSAGGNTVSAVADISVRQEVTRMLDEIRESLGPVEILVNNAGLWLPKSFFDLDDATWDRTFAVNLKGMFICSQLAAKTMWERKCGRIINLASISSKVPFPDSVHYGTAKAGVVQFTRSLALLLAPKGITVNAIAPGSTQTEMLDMFVQGRPDRLQNVLQGNAERHLPGIPMGCVASPEDQAAMILFLASNAAAHITGQTIFIDGGQSL